MTLDIVALVDAGFVLAALALFRFCSPSRAALVVVLGGWVLLPVGHYPAGSADAVFPYWITGLAVPSDMLLTKAWIPPVTALLGVALFDREALRRLRLSGFDLPVALWCLWPLLSAGLTPADSPPAAVASAYLAGVWAAPWVLGRALFATPAGQRQLAEAVAASALACLPLSLVEGPLGPVIYGWLLEPHPFRFDGASRYVGFRPIGLFEHGNQFGLWIALGALAAIWLARTAPPPRRRLPVAVAVVLVAMALAAQSIGAILMLGLGFAFLSASGRIRPRRIVALLAAALLIGGATYLSGAVPIVHIAKDTALGRQVVDAFRTAGRGSFTWRIAQDQRLLVPAMAHPIAGSGAWDWWRPQGSRPWGMPLLVIGQFGLAGLLLMATTWAGSAARTAWQASRASGLQAQGLPLLLATLVLLALADALMNTFIYFPALLAAGSLARRPPSAG